MASDAKSTLDAAEQLIAQLGNPDISARYQSWRASAYSPALSHDATARERGGGGGGVPEYRQKAVLADVSNIPLQGGGVGARAGTGYVAGDLTVVSSSSHNHNNSFVRQWDSSSTSNITAPWTPASTSTRPERNADILLKQQKLSRMGSGESGRAETAGGEGDSMFDSFGLPWNGKDENEAIVEEIDRICRCVFP
jgi:hypothetical protein